MIDKNLISKIITDPEATQTLVKEADKLGKYLGKQLSTSQIRAIFGEVRQIEAQWGMGVEQRKKALNRLILLKPKMAYRARKERGKAVQELVHALDPALDEVIKESNPNKQDENFRRFVDFFEAILAYHKAHGGN